MSKSIAIMETPKGCSSCVFHICKYHHPFWGKEKQNRKGYICQLDEQRRLLDLDINDETTTAKWCPLNPYSVKETVEHLRHVCRVFERALNNALGVDHAYTNAYKEAEEELHKEDENGKNL